MTFFKEGNRLRVPLFFLSKTHVTLGDQMRLTTRFGGIALLLFLALFFDFNDFEFKWSMLTGICEEVYADGKFTCGEGSISIPTLKLELFVDFPTLIIIWAITFFAVYSRKGNRIKMWEEASHVVKDVGELGAALTALLIFFGPFNERSMSIGFGIAFLCYLYGLTTSIFIKTYVQNLKRKEQNM